MLLSREELDKTAQMDPQVAEYYDKNPPPPPGRTAHMAREGLETYTQRVLSKLVPPPASQKEFYHDISMRDGYDSTLKIFKPDDGRTGPLVVLCFGGGFVAGSKDQLTETARTMVRLFGATVINISYRLAPEYKFPYAQHDAIDSLRWIADNASGPLLGADPSQGFLLGGVSAGAAITASLSRLFQTEKLAHPLTGQWLCVPSIMSNKLAPEKYKPYHISAEQNSNAPGLTKEGRTMMKEAAEWDDSSPLRFAVQSENLISGQPRTYTQVDGMDPLRDDGLIYDEMLREAGVPTRIDLYPGCPHAHSFMMRGYEIGDRARIDEIVGFGWLLEKEVSREDAASALGISS